MNGVISGEDGLHKTRFDICADRASYLDWMHGESESGRDRIIELLRTAIREDLSEKQMTYLTRYYIDGMTQGEIGELYGVDKSSVSRTLSRAKNNLKKVMKYADKRILALYFQGGPNGRTNNTKKRAAEVTLRNRRVAESSGWPIHDVPWS